MYERAGDTVIVRPKEGIRISLVPPPDDSYVEWKAGWLGKLDKDLYDMVECSWIPTQYIPFKERMKYRQIVAMRNGGRSSEIVIPTLKIKLGGIEYHLNVLNCKGTGVSTDYLRIRRKTIPSDEKKLRVAYAKSLYFGKEFRMVDSIISREVERHDRPMGGMTIPNADSEVSYEQMMIDEGLPHTPYAITTVIPEGIRANINWYNAKNVYPGRTYQECHDSGRWVRGPLAQVKRFFTTNIRMNAATHLEGEFQDMAGRGRGKLKWLQPKAIARLIGTSDGRFERYLRKAESEGMVGNFLGSINGNRTIDGLLTDGENLEFREDLVDRDFTEIFKGSEKFLKAYSKRMGFPHAPVLDAYGTFRRKGFEEKEELVIPS
jgi:hypothetical protein